MQFGKAADDRKTHNLNDLPPALRAYQAMLIAIPLVGTGMTVYDLAVAGGIEVAMAAVSGGHSRWSRRLTALVRSEGT